MDLLTDEEREIYNLIKEFLKHKVFFSIIDILDFLSYRLKFNPNINRSTF